MTTTSDPYADPMDPANMVDHLWDYRANSPCCGEFGTTGRSDFGDAIAYPYALPARQQPAEDECDLLAQAVTRSLNGDDEAPAQFTAARGRELVGRWFADLTP